MFFLFSIIKNPVYILPVEILNGVTFALFYSGAISYANLSTPAGAEGTFQGVIGTALTGLGLSFNIFYKYSDQFIYYFIFLRLSGLS